MHWWWWVSDVQRTLVASLPYNHLLWDFQHLDTCGVPLDYSQLIWLFPLLLSCTPTQDAGKKHLELIRSFVASDTALKICYEWGGIFVTSGVHHPKQTLAEEPVDPLEQSMFPHTCNRKMVIYFLSSDNTLKWVSFY